jgi:hypothetical protein
MYFMCYTTPAETICANLGCVVMARGSRSHLQRRGRIIDTDIIQSCHQVWYICDKSVSTGVRNATVSPATELEMIVTHDKIPYLTLCVEQLQGRLGQMTACMPSCARFMVTVLCFKHLQTKPSLAPSSGIDRPNPRLEC